MEDFEKNNSEEFEIKEQNLNEPFLQGGYTYSNVEIPHYKAPVKKEKRTYGFVAILIAAGLALVIGATSGAVAGVLVSRNKEPVYIEPDYTASEVNITVDKTAENMVEAVAIKLAPSVVGIRTTTSVYNFFGGTNQASGEGSGVVYSEDGYIITNYHVIKEAVENRTGSKIEVFLDTAEADGFEASVIGYNIAADLAVIKINVKGLTAVQFADSDELKVGQFVITMGNPGGLEFMDSVTYGIISGLNRVVSSDSGVELIQTDAAINPGNSGGALVNSSGELVGINSSKIVSEEFEGMGFAIPSNTVREICNNLIEKQGKAEPYVGISISEKYTAEALEYYGYPKGAVVLSVAESSPAEDAGIARGDIITEFGSVKITNYTVLQQAISQTSPGEKVTVKLYRSGRYYSTKLTIGSNS